MKLPIFVPELIAIKKSHQMAEIKTKPTDASVEDFINTAGIRPVWVAPTRHFKKLRIEYHMKANTGIH